mmetsp:Transcript_19612/g.32699  ORF Transcript_19612/g.32699 Transcript_19612/m.32699 type:complete len:89 (+) Transcript_19612:40-306(+)
MSVQADREKVQARVGRAAAVLELDVVLEEKGARHRPWKAATLMRLQVQVVPSKQLWKLKTAAEHGTTVGPLAKVSSMTRKAACPHLSH